MKKYRIASTVLCLGLLFSCREAADAGNGIANREKIISGKGDLLPIEEMVFLYERERFKSPFDRVIIPNLFPEFFVDKSGFQRNIKGSDGSIENRTLPADKYIRLLADRVDGKPKSVVLVVLVSRHKSVFDEATSSFEKSLIFGSSSCSAVALSRRGNVFSLAIWAKTQPRISATQPEMYKCLTKTFAYAYGIEAKTAYADFFDKSRIPLPDRDCAFYSDATESHQRWGASEFCSTPTPKFNSMLMLLSNKLRSLGCDGSTSVLCQAPFGPVLLGDEKQITQLGHDLEVKWAQNMARSRRIWDYGDSALN